MKELDDALREALRREEPHAGFAERVLRRAAEEAAVADRPPRSGRPFLRWAAAAAIVAAISGGIQYRAAHEARQERVRGEAAKQQVLEALRIAGAKLHTVQSKIKGMGS